VEESGRRQQIKPTGCKNDLLKHSDAAGASPSAVDKSIPSAVATASACPSPAKAAQTKAQFLLLEGLEVTCPSPPPLLPSLATFTPSLAMSSFLVNKVVSVFLKGIGFVVRPGRIIHNDSLALGSFESSITNACEPRAVALTLLKEWLFAYLYSSFCVHSFLFFPPLFYFSPFFFLILFFLTQISSAARIRGLLLDLL